MSLLLLHLTLSLWYCTRTCYCLYYARLCLSYCIAGTCHLYKNIDNISITPAPVHLPVYSEQHPVSVIIVLFHASFIDALAPSKLISIWGLGLKLLYQALSHFILYNAQNQTKLYSARCQFLLRSMFSPLLCAEPYRCSFCTSSSLSYYFTLHCLTFYSTGPHLCLYHARSCPYILIAPIWVYIT